MRSYKEILDELQKVKYDFISFLSGEKKDSIAIMASDYSDAGEPVGGNDLGEMYHILLFRDHKDDPEKYDDVDSFEAILVSPSEYIARLIPAGFYGVVGRKTTTSEKIFKKLLDKTLETVYN
jgi:hypothetical protein